ncbi:MAG TPA: hypothetical protein VF607_12125, partial [Verrucomicrobiae bacterium]
SKFFRAEHRHNQVKEQQHGYAAHNEVFHNDSRLKFLANPGVPGTDREKAGHRYEIDKIVHKPLSLLRGEAASDNQKPG